jgi:hypothetical protein
MRRSIRDNEAVERNRRITEATLNVFDGLKELDLGIAKSKIPDSLRIHECNVLTVVEDQPKNEIWVEIACFKKADPTAFAQVAQ